MTGISRNMIRYTTWCIMWWPGKQKLNVKKIWQKFRQLENTYQLHTTKHHYVNMTHHKYIIQEVIPSLTLKRSRMSYSAISRQEYVPRTTVMRLIKKHLKENGASLGVSIQRGLSNGSTQRKKTAIIRKNPWQTLAKLCKYGTGVPSLNPRKVYRVLDKARISQHSSVGAPCWKCTRVTSSNQICTWTDIHLSLIFLRKIFNLLSSD